MGTGLYVDDIDKKVQEKLLENISQIRFGKQGYIFVNDYDGRALVSSGKKNSGDKYVWEVFNKFPDKARKAYQQQVEAIKNPEGDYIYYQNSKLGKLEESPKASFIYGMQDLEWIIGAGLYLDDIEVEISYLSSKLKRQFLYKLVMFLVLGLVIGSLLLYYFNKLRLNLANDVNLFSDFLKKLAFSYEPINRKVIKYSELDEMASLANKMLHDYEIAQQRVKELNESLEEKVILRTEELKQANTELNEFAYIISHDLKAPLRGIAQLVGWIQQDYDEVLGEEGKEHFKLLNQRVVKMSSLIDAVLKYSRASTLSDEKQIFNSIEAVNNTVSLLNVTNEVNIEITGDFPRIEMNQIKLEQVFQNLISNAIEFNPKPQKEVKISFHRTDEELVFSVSDNGNGIEEKFHEQIFKLFTSLENRGVKSTGIGLSIVHKIISLYKGKVWLESKDGEGSCFYFSLPAQLEIRS